MIHILDSEVAMNKKVVRLIVLFLGLVLITYTLASWFFSNLIIAVPTSTLENGRAATGSPSDFGLPDPVEVKIDNGEVTLAGWYFDNPLDGNCGVQFMHGFTGTRYHALYWVPLFWERGCDILAYDHRAHGESTPAFHTYGFYEKQDALAARNWFAEHSGLDPSRIGIGGVSYGAATALQLAPMIPDAAFILADSSYQSLPAIVSVQAVPLIGETLGRFMVPGALAISGLRAGFNPWAVSPEESVAEANMPILLIHSRTDGFTPWTHSQAIYKNSNKGRAVLHVNAWGSAHGGDIGTDFAAYDQLFDAFLVEHVPDFGLTPKK